MRLPILLRRPRHRLAYAAFWLPYIALYQVINRFPMFDPRPLPFTFLDRAVPFVPELLPLYVGYIPFFWWTVARSETDEVATRIFYATHFQLAVCAVVWMFFPVTMPREQFYAGEAFNWADTFWRWFDAPNNCFPSLHVANCLLFTRFNRERSLPRVHAAVALAIIASTALVKQHYVADAIAGAMVYTLTVALAARVQIIEHPAAEPEEVRATAG